VRFGFNAIGVKEKNFSHLFQVKDLLILGRGKKTPQKRQKFFWVESEEGTFPSSIDCHVERSEKSPNIRTRASPLSNRHKVSSRTSFVRDLRPFLKDKNSFWVKFEEGQFTSSI